MRAEVENKERRAGWQSSTGADQENHLVQNTSRKTPDQGLKDMFGRTWEDRLRGAPFQILGHNHGRYYFLPRAGGQIVRLTAILMRPRNLFRLAPLRWWVVSRYGLGGKTAWDQAACDLIRACEAAGIIDLAAIEERAALIEYDSGAPRAEAERRALAETADAANSGEL